MVDLLVNGLETPPLHRSSFGVVFLCLKHYLIYVNTNVSNARMNIPKFRIDGTNEKIRLGKLMGKDFIITSF